MNASNKLKGGVFAYAYDITQGSFEQDIQWKKPRIRVDYCNESCCKPFLGEKVVC
jgi:hypothetical protein